MYDRLCRHAAANTVRTICEVGFNSGESAMLFLEVMPFAHVVSFDMQLPQKTWILRL